MKIYFATTNKNDQKETLDKVEGYHRLVSFYNLGKNNLTRGRMNNKIKKEGNMKSAAERMRERENENKLIERVKESRESANIKVWDYRVTIKNIVKTEKDKKDYLFRIATEVRSKIHNIKREMFSIGALLCEAKEYLQHGEFTKWVEDNFDFSYATAFNFMNVYKACLDNPEIINTVKASVLYEIASPKFPNDLRQFIFDHGNFLRDLKTGEIKDICQMYKNKEIDIDSPEIQGLISYWEDNRQFYDYKSVIQRCFEIIEQLYEGVRRITTQAMLHMKWPEPEDDRYMGFTWEYASKLEYLYKQMHEMIDATGPNVYAVIEGFSHKPPLLFEQWDHPGYVERENAKEIRASKKWHERKLINLRCGKS